MFSNARGMAICIGVTGVASILLWFYFKNRIETVETKLDNMFNMIQNFSQPESGTVSGDVVADYYQQVDPDGVVDPFESIMGKEVQYENQSNSTQLPTEMFEKEIEEVVNNNAKLIEVSEDSGEDSSSEEEVESEAESEEEKQQEVVKKIEFNHEEEPSDSLDEVESEDESEDEKEKEELKEEVKEYSHMKVSELKKLAQTKGLTGYTKLNKAGLVNLLENN
jgi:hypothetical protein